MVIQMLFILEERGKLQLVKLFEVQNKPVPDHFVDHMIIFDRHIIIVKNDVRIGTQLNRFWKPI